MKRKHKVLSWWASLILTFVGMLSIVGVTVLVMYLTGRFNEEIIWPADMTFSNEVEGMGYFGEDENLYVASDFSLTLSTTTEDVTKDEVRLFLDGDKNKTSNGVITVPKTARLNKPFEIRLEKDEQGLAKGGMATITAVSEDETLIRQTINVFVDRPAQDFEVSIAQHEGENVVIGSTFNLEMKFTPEESKKAFSKNDEEKRFFFSNTSAFIDYDWDNENFYTKMLSGDGYDEITVYAFANSYFQKQVLDRFASVLNRPSELNSDVTTYLSQNIKPGETTYLTKTIKVYVTEATVTIVNMEDNKTMQGTCDKFFVLTTKSSSTDEENRGTLGISIQEDSTSPSLDGLLGNVGIKIPKEETIKIDNRRMDRPEISGKVLKVVKTSAGEEGADEETYEMTYEQFDYANYSKYVEADEGTEYYILPSTSTKNTTDYYWRIAASDTSEHTLSVNFFYEKPDGSIANFFDFSGKENPEKTFKFVAQHHQDEPAKWINKNRIELEISFDKEGNEESAQVSLSDFVEEVPSTNVYTKTKFFLFATNGNGAAVSDDLKIEDYFNVKAGVKYDKDYLSEKLNILGQNNEGGFVLYELETDDLMIAKKRLPSNLNAYVLIAILKTDVDGNVETTAEDDVTKYQIVNLSDLKAVSVESSLSIARMTPQFSFTDGAVTAKSESGEYYLPAVNRDTEQLRSKVIDFLFKYECADESDTSSWDVDARKISNAFDTGLLKVVCTDEHGQEYGNQYVFLNGSPREMYGDNEDQLQTTGTRRKTLYFQGEFSIAEEFFASSASGDIVTEKDIYLLLKYDNGHDQFTKSLQGKNKEADKQDFDHFVVYYQIPGNLLASYMSNDELKDSKNISVTIGAGQEGSGDVEMKWGSHTLGGESGQATTIQAVLDYVNSQLDYRITDQHGLAINTDVDTGLYRILFREENGANLLRFNDKQNSIINFVSTNSQSKTTKLIVEVIENITDGKVVKSDELTFTITSVGVSKLEKEKGEDVIASPDLSTDDNYEDNKDTGMVTIRKRLKPGDGGDKLDLTKLVRIYLGESESYYNSDIKVQFNPTFISRLEEKSTLSKDLAAMLHFDEIDDTSTDTMSAYKDKDLTKLSIRYPFNADTTLEFIITDADNSRFYIPLNLVLVKQADIVNGFDTFNHEKGYDDYLVKLGGTSPALFADHEYDLKDLFLFTNTKESEKDTYSWSDALKTDGLLVTSQGQENLLTLKKEGAKLKIGAIDHFEPVRFTLYYGVKSYYALNTGEVTVYINPNIAIVEKSIQVGQNAPFVNLNELSSAKISDNFVFCRATDYVDKVVKGSEGVEKLANGSLIDISSWQFTNITAQENNLDRKFINIGKKDNENVYTFYDATQELNLALGQNVGQRFSVFTTAGNINAVVVKEFSDGTRKVIRSVDDKNVARTAEIEIDIGFGKDEIETINKILYRQKQSGTISSPEHIHVQIVKFKVKENGKDVLKTFVVLASETTYYIESAFTYASSTGGNLSNTKNNEVYTGTMQAFFSSDNTLTVNASPKDANGGSLKTLSVTINVIVSRIGEKFVYYAPNGAKDDVSDAEKKFNSFKDADFYALLHDPASVDAFQEVEAGSTFTIFHIFNKNGDGDIDTLQEGEEGNFGFYYDYKKSHADSSSIQAIKYQAYKLENGKKTILNASDLCSLSENKLTLNHLSTDYQNTYIEIELPFSYNGMSFSFKYRIKVLPDFTAGSVNYPYAENVEHLDPLASAYVGENKYEIELDEKFGETNSKLSQNEKQRFVDPKLTQEDAAKYAADAVVTGTYEIASAKVGEQDIKDFENNNFFTAKITDKKLSVTLKQQDVKLVLVLKKTFTIDNLKMFGGDLSYELRFNMGTPYNAKVSHQHKGAGQAEPQKAAAEKAEYQEVKGGIFETTIKASEEESIFDIRITVGENVSTPVNDFNFFIFAKNGGELSSALQTFKDHENAYAYLENGENNNKLLHLKPLADISKNVEVEIGIFTAERVALRLKVTVAGFYTYKLANSFSGGKEYSFIGSENAIFTSFTDDSSGTPINDEKNGYNLEITLEYGDDQVSLQNNQVKKTKLVKLTEGKPTEGKITFAHLPADVAFHFKATVTKKSESKSYEFLFEITVAKSVDIDSVYTTDIGNIYGGVKYLLDINNENGKVLSEDDVFETIDDLANKAQLTAAGVSEKYEFDSSVSDGSITFDESDKSKITFKPENVGKDTESSKNFQVKYSFANSDQGQSDDNFTLSYTLKLTFHILPSVDVDLHTPAPDGKIYSSAEYLDTTNNGSETAPRYKAEIKNFFESADFAMEYNGEEGKKHEFKRVTVEEVQAIKNKSGKTITLDKKLKISVSKIENVILTYSFNGKGHAITETSSTTDKKFTELDNVSFDDNISAMTLTFELVDASKDGKVEFAIEVNNVTAKLGGTASNYVVQVLRGGVSAVSIATNSTNYDNDEETIYAEDLASYSDKALFKEDRIIQFNAKQTGTYHLKFTKGEEVKHVEVFAAQANVVTNFDAGEPLTGYAFAGAYSSYTSGQGFSGEPDQNSNFNSLPIITSRLVAIYAQNTADQKEIVLNENVNFAIAKEGVNKPKYGVADDGSEQSSPNKYLKYTDVKLSSTDNGKHTKYTIVIVKNFGELYNQGTTDNKLDIIPTSGTYNMALKIDFEVTNNADGFEEYTNSTHNTAHTSVFKQDLVAGMTYTLFGDGGAGTLNNSLHIKSPRRNADYTREMMKASAGKIKLELYGFGDVPILGENGGIIQESGSAVSPVAASVAETWSEEEKTLAKAAGRIHESLISEEVKLSNGDTIKYHTGLTPRADGFTINGNGDDKTNQYNYLVLKSQTDGTGEVDYNLLAQGCNNDGNHVMVKVTYSVDTGEGTIKECHNLLFRVVPNEMTGDVASNGSNTNVTFVQNFGGNSATVNADNTRTFGKEQTFANNYSNPFIIKDTEFKQNENGFNLVNTKADGTAADGSASVINAKMYHKDANDIRNFTFTFENGSQTITTDNETKIANDYGSALNLNEGWGTPQNSNGRYKLSVGFKKDNAVSLGEKLYYIDFKNAFGYQGRFFFKIVASDNPTIKNMDNDPLKEGDRIAVGTEFKQIDIKADSEQYYQYKEFTYDEKGENDTLQFTAIPEKVKLVAVLKNALDDEGTKDITREITDIKSKEIKICDGEKKWKKGSSDQEIDVTSEQMKKGATITIYAKYKEPSDKNEPFDATVKYGNKKDTGFTESEDKDLKANPITIVNSDSIYGQPVFEETVGTTTPEKKEGTTTPTTLHTVTLSNLSVNAFDAKAPVDSKTQEDYVSEIENIQVERIDFYYEGKWIGGTYGNGKPLTDELNYYKNGGSAEEKPASEDGVHFSQPLITNSGKYFSVPNDEDKSKQDWKQGIDLKTKNENYYTVPTIEPRVFGNLETLSNVTMNITLTTMAGSESERNKAVLSRQVSITRENVDLFDNANIMDGNSPQTKAELNGISSVLNDTIEVTLDPQESTTFLVHDKQLYDASDEPSSSENEKIKDSVSMNPDGSVTVTRKEYQDNKTNVTTWNVQPITIKNSANYTQTYYYSITDHLLDVEFRKENPNKDSQFYIYEFNFLKENKDGTQSAAETGAMFAYNGKTSEDTSDKLNVNKIKETKEGDVVKYTIEPSTPTSNLISAYPQNGALRMYIPSVNALGSDNTMSRTLYFLYVKGDKSYQYSQEFKIKPQYSEVKTGNSSTEIEVSDYVEVSNGTEKFYYIPLSAWAGGATKLTLKESVGNGTKPLGWKDGDTSSEVPYKFTFESDSAFVDEFGTLMTSNNFSISGNVIDVKIFMNVSGFDGNFEERNQKIEIGSFKLRLKEVGIGSLTEVGGAAAAAEESTIKGKLYTFTTANAPSGIIYVPVDFKAKKTDGISLEEPGLGSATNSGPFACAVGTTVDFSKLLKTDAKGKRNVTYHILNVGGEDIYSKDNINTWTFATSGEKKVTILRTSVGTSGNDYVYELLTVTMHVYDNNPSTTKAFAVDLANPSFALSNLDSTENAKWYELDKTTNKVKECENGTITISQDANSSVQQKSFIMKEENSDKYKTFDVTFYTYQASDSKSVNISVAKGAKFNLQNIAQSLKIESGYHFFEMDKSGAVGEQISTLSPDGISASGEKNLLCLKKDNTAQKITVNVFVTNSSADKTLGLFANKTKQDDKFKVDLKNIVSLDANETGIEANLKKMFGLSEPQNFKVYTRDENGILTEITDADDGHSVEVSSGNQDKFDIVVSWDSKNVKLVSLLLYYYENTETITVTADNLGERDLFDLSSVNEQVISAIKEKQGDVSGVVTYSTINPETGLRSVVTRIGNLANKGGSAPDYEGNFYVEIGGRAFLIKLQLYAKSHPQE